MNLLINCISARSAPHILSTKDECTFLFSNFLIIGLCNSSAICLLDIISFLIAPAEAFLSKKIYKPLIEASPRWYLSCFAFLAILNALSRKTLSAIVLLFKSSKSPEATSCWKQALSNLLDNLFRICSFNLIFLYFLYF